MPNCPSCGEEIEEQDKFCNNCGQSLKNSGNTASPDESLRTEGSAENNTVGESEEDKRLKWLEAQKAFKNELSGLKTELKDEIKKKPEMEFPFPSPYARYYGPQGEFEITGRNYAPYNMDPAGIRNAERLEPRENVTEDKPRVSTNPHNEAIIESVNMSTPMPMFEFYLLLVDHN